jgi:alkylhydroperoxidase family enzyme
MEVREEARMRRYVDLAERLREAVLKGKGETAASLRQAAAAHSARLGGLSETPVPGEVPAGLRDFVDATARHAYRVTAEDVQALRQAGYSEDAIFEIAVSVAVGGGLARLERGLAALDAAAVPTAPDGGRR